MDFGEFLEHKLWLHIIWGPEIDESIPERFRPKRFDGRIAYGPGQINDADMGMLAWIGRARMSDIDVDAIRAEQAAMASRDDSRAVRRARERQEKRLDATPVGKIKQPSYLDMLERLIVDWDLEWRDPSFKGDRSEAPMVPVPLTRENLNRLEPGLKLHIVMAIMGDYLERPNLTTLSGLFSETTTANGQSNTPSASEPNSTV